MNRETRLADNKKYFRELEQRTAAKNKKTYNEDATRLELEKQRTEELSDAGKNSKIIMLT